MSYTFSNSAARAAEARRPKAANIREEAKGAILSEQLSYLLTHANCSIETCPDCARLRSVEEVLLKPFRVKVYSGLKPAA